MSVVTEQHPEKPSMTSSRPLADSFHYAKYARKQGAHVKDIEWHFDSGYGIMDYTRVFIEAHENRGVAVTRDTVEKFWVEAVKTHFKNSKQQRTLHLRQINSALINDCWIHRVFDRKSFASPFVQDTIHTPESEGLRVWRSKRLVNRQPIMIMFLHDTDDCKAPMSKTPFDVTRAVLLPYLGLWPLKAVSYRLIATRVRRGDGQPLDQALMHLVWRGIIFNLFYFESEELKQTKLAEEDWKSLQMSADLNSSSPKRERDEEDESSSPKRVRDESDQSSSKRVTRLVDSMRV